MPATIKYTDDGLNFSLMGATGQILTETPVPETGVAYVSTRIGPRVVTFPNYDLPDKGKVKVNTVFSLLPDSTAVVGKCASAEDIAASYEDDDDEEDVDLDEDEYIDDDIDDEEADDEEDDE